MDNGRGGTRSDPPARAGSAENGDVPDVDAVLPDVPDHELVFGVREVRKVYEMGDVEVHALRSIDLDVRRGELVVMLGASGSGKSTLLNILGGLDVPTSGTVRFGDLDLATADEQTRTQFRRDAVGFVFQFYNLIPSLTARENVALVTDIVRDSMPAEEALERAGLPDRMDHFPSQLSGGEQQRIAIARAIAKRPEILLCDEPTGALDYETGKLVLDAIARVNVELGTTTMIITHNAAIASIGDRVIRLSSGHITETWSNKARASAADISW